jgi:hypothetical protein
VTALGGPPNAPTRPILQIVSAGYKKFSDITDQELLAECLHPKAKLSAVDLRIILRRVYALYYHRWLADDDIVFCVAFVKVADMEEGIYIYKRRKGALFRNFESHRDRLRFFFIIERLL